MMLMRLIGSGDVKYKHRTKVASFPFFTLQFVLTVLHGSGRTKMGRPGELRIGKRAPARN